MAEQEIKKYVESGIEPEWMYIHYIMDKPTFGGNQLVIEEMFQLCQKYNIEPKYFTTHINGKSFIGYISLEGFSPTVYVIYCMKYQFRPVDELVLINADFTPAYNNKSFNTLLDLIKNEEYDQIENYQYYIKTLSVSKFKELINISGTSEMMITLTSYYNFKIASELDSKN